MFSPRRIRKRWLAVSAPGAAAVMLVVSSGAAATSLRFHGFGAGDVDRVKILIDDIGDPNDEPGPPIDVGATDFTIEFWIRGLLAENDAGIQDCGGDGWIYGHVVIDRDRWEPGGRDWGISVGEGRMTFGCAGTSGATTICGETVVLDGEWHHVAADRRRSDGRLRLFVDGVLDASADGPDGDVSYPGNETPQGTNCNGGPCVNSDPYVVFGAEKHDAGSEFPSFAGWIDEVRFSTVLRYANDFTPPGAPFVPDADTAALFHCDEGSGDVVGDDSGAPGGPSHGLRRFGGTPVPGPEWSNETPFPGATSIATAGDGAPPADRAERAPKLVFEAHPNPSLGQTLFFLRSDAPLDAVYTIAILDVAGRERARLSGSLARGSALAVWNGRAADGTPLAPGVYFAKATTAGVEASTKVTVR